MRIRRRITMALAGLFVLGGLSATVASSSAFASNGDQWCHAGNGTWDCANAWGGGPWVDVYTTGVTNNDFSQYRTPQGNTELEFTGGGGDTGLCIGDANNSQYDARAYLVGCPGTGTGGWGTQIGIGNSGCPSGTWWIFDYHWNGYLVPHSDTRGDNFYLNGPKTCYADFLGA